MDNPFLKTFDETKAWLDGMGIVRYKIRDDLTVDVIHWDVNISDRGLKCIPVRFGVVHGYFSCGENQLTSLNGAPYKCEHFMCHKNQLTNLEGSPVECPFIFSCNDNQLTSLVGAPKACDFFNCANNRLTNLDGGPNICRDIYCIGNPDLIDISVAPGVREVRYDPDVFAKNQAKQQLVALDFLSDSSRKTMQAKPGRAL